MPLSPYDFVMTHERTHQPTNNTFRRQRVAGTRRLMLAIVVCSSAHVYLLQVQTNPRDSCSSARTKTLNLSLTSLGVVSTNWEKQRPQKAATRYRKPQKHTPNFRNLHALYIPIYCYITPNSTLEGTPTNLGNHQVEVCCARVRFRTWHPLLRRRLEAHPLVR